MDERSGRMGAQIQVDGKIAVIEGVEKPHREPGCAPVDLRAGAAMIITAWRAPGHLWRSATSTHIEAGYEDIVRKLSGVGADIRVVITPMRSRARPPAG